MTANSAEGMKSVCHKDHETRSGRSPGSGIQFKNNNKRTCVYVLYLFLMSIVHSCECAALTSFNVNLGVSDLCRSCYLPFMQALVS